MSAKPKGHGFIFDDFSRSYGKTRILENEFLVFGVDGSSCELGSKLLRTDNTRFYRDFHCRASKPHTGTVDPGSCGL